MKIFIDYYHPQLHASLDHVINHRLGHEVYYPSGELSMMMGWNSGDHWPNTIGVSEFLETKFDVVITNNHGTADHFAHVIGSGSASNNAKRVAVCVCEPDQYNLELWPNVICANHAATMFYEGKVHMIEWMQEVDPMFQGEWEDVTEESLRRVGMYIHAFGGFQTSQIIAGEYLFDHCLKCLKPIGKHPYLDSLEYMGTFAGLCVGGGVDYQMFGTGNEEHGGIALGDQPDVLAQMKSRFLTVHYKTWEGFGHTMAQSISLGRPVLVPRGIMGDKLARRFLVPNLTCFEFDPRDPTSLWRLVERLTSDLDVAKKISQDCYEASHMLFRWDDEAANLGAFLERLV